VPRQQVRVQQRKIKPKAAQIEPPPPPPKGAMQARMLEGHSPETVIRLTRYLAIYQVALLLVAVATAVFVFPEIPLKILDVAFFLAAIILPGTLVWPALLLALRDRKAAPQLVQGQMVMASPVSMVYGLGMLYVNTRQNKVQLNVERRLLKSIPQTQVQVALRVSPNLRHVSSVQVIGPRMAAGVPSEVPDEYKIAERFPIYALLGAYGGVFGIGLILLFLPLGGALLWLHMLLVPVGMGIAVFASRFLTSYFQKRLEARLKP
jgi:hypothetical protein